MFWVHVCATTSIRRTEHRQQKVNAIRLGKWTTFLNSKPAGDTVSSYWRKPEEIHHNLEWIVYKLRTTNCSSADSEDVFCWQKHCDSGLEPL